MHRNSKHLSSFAALAAILFSPFALAQDATSAWVDGTINVEAQPLAEALKDFSAQTGLQLAYVATLAENKTSNGVEDAKSPDDALDAILDNTGLEYQFVNDETIAIGEATKPRGNSDSKNSKITPVLMARNRTTSQEAPRSQPQVTSSNEAEGEEQVLEQIIVTGSRIRGAQNASPVVTITRDEIDLAGYATVEEVVENLPQNFGAGATLDTNVDVLNQAHIVGGDVQNFAGGTSVNLRGLGADSTLVLLNGRRMSPSGAASAFTNIGSIPISAIERIEVMTDGASAIYGSDAIGGVINFILRDSYEGAETRLRFGSDDGGDRSDVLFGQSFGTSWDRGNVLLTYEYYDAEPLAMADRPFTASNDLRPFGGTDWRSPGGNPGNIVAGGQTFAIPEGQDGTALTPADFVGLENTRYFHNSRQFGDQIPSQERHSVFMHLGQAVGAIELFGIARYMNNEQEQLQGGASGSVATLPVFGDNPATSEAEGNPWFVDPTGTGLPFVVVEYATAEDFGAPLSLVELESAGATLGGRFEFSDSWSSELAINWSEEEGRTYLANQFDFLGLFAAMNSPDPNQAFNPFGDGANTSPAVIESLVSRDKILSTTYRNALSSVNFDVHGETFALAGGAVKVSAGIDFREESLDTELFNINTGTSTGQNSLERDILAVYAEVFFPLVGSANRRAGMQQLEVSLAARHEDYSDFGSSTNPKLGVIWSPTESLALRGTVGTSFRAPSLTDLDDSFLSNWGYIPEGFLGIAPFGFLLKNGRNSELQAQEATTWTAGFQWRPEKLDGLSLDMTYFDIDFEGRIENPAPGITFVAAIGDPRFASVQTLDPSDEEIAAFVNSPNYRESIIIGGPFPAEDILSGALPVEAIFDNRLTNLAQSVATGIELQLGYVSDTALGLFSFGLNGSYVFDFERRLLPTDPLVEEVDTFGRPVDLRARGNVGWSRGGWSVSGFVNYTDGYTDNVSDPDREVDSWTTVDLTIAYETQRSEGFFSDIRLGLTTQNLFDEDPPFVDTVGGVGYDAVNANPIGRFFSLHVTREW